jgi:hypothetical protein
MIGVKLEETPMRTAAAALLFLAAPLAVAGAQTPAEFYKGKQIKFIVGTSSGQDYDRWARLIARHITRHIPGQPSMVVENMPGAGHIVATNHLYSVAPRDGTVIGMVSRNMTDAYIMKVKNTRFDPARFIWLGSPEINYRVLFVGTGTGLKTVPELFERELIVGAPGGAQGVTAAPILLKNLLGLKFKIVTGYRSPGDIVLGAGSGSSPARCACCSTWSLNAYRGWACRRSSNTPRRKSSGRCSPSLPATRGRAARSSRRRRCLRTASRCCGAHSMQP